MARGIDAAAHLGALATGTVAVVAGGIDIVYPEENRGLYDALAPSRRGGRRVAARHRAAGPAFPAPQPDHLGHGAGRRRGRGGGAVGLADHRAFALEQGREVFAVPGSPLDPRCRGSNDLLRSGATLTENAADVIDATRAAAAAAPPPPPANWTSPPRHPESGRWQPAAAPRTAS